MQTDNTCQFTIARSGLELVGFQLDRASRIIARVIDSNTKHEGLWFAVELYGCVALAKKFLKRAAPAQQRPTPCAIPLAENSLYLTLKLLEDMERDLLQTGHLDHVEWLAGTYAAVARAKHVLSQTMIENDIDTLAEIVAQ